MSSIDEITPLEVGSAVPDFTLDDVLSGVPVALADLRGDVVVLNFWSGECDWSRRYDDYFAGHVDKWAERGVRLIHINSNANESLADTDRVAHDLDIMAPILDDAGNVVADAYGATNTPHVFVITADGHLAYQGAIDDTNFRQKEATVNYLDAAVEAVLAGREPAVTATPAYGCTIVRSFEE